MTTDEYFSHLAETFNRALETCHSKCHDYAGNQDPFRTFRLSETLNICSVEQSILARMSEKLGRVCNLIGQKNIQKHETVEDSIQDLINYSAILLAYLDSKNG